MSKQLGAFLALAVMTAVVLTACGSSASDKAETPLQQAEAEYRELNKEFVELNAKAEAKFDEYDGAYKQGKSFAEQQELTNEWEALSERPDEILKEQEKIASRIETMKGCDKQCQAQRTRAINLNTKCFTTLTKEGFPFRAVQKECDRRFPIPKEDILQGSR